MKKAKLILAIAVIAISITGLNSCKKTEVTDSTNTPLSKTLRSQKNGTSLKINAEDGMLAFQSWGDFRTAVEFLSNQEGVHCSDYYNAKLAEGKQADEISELAYAEQFDYDAPLVSFSNEYSYVSLYSKLSDEYQQFLNQEENENLVDPFESRGLTKEEAVLLNSEGSVSIAGETVQYTDLLKSSRSSGCTIWDQTANDKYVGSYKMHCSIGIRPEWVYSQTTMYKKSGSRWILKIDNLTAGTEGQLYSGNMCLPDQELVYKGKTLRFVTTITHTRLIDSGNKAQHGVGLYGYHVAGSAGVSATFQF